MSRTVVKLPQPSLTPLRAPLVPRRSAQFMNSWHPVDEAKKQKFAGAFVRLSRHKWPLSPLLSRGR